MTTHEEIARLEGELSKLMVHYNATLAVIRRDLAALRARVEGEKATPNPEEEAHRVASAKDWCELHSHPTLTAVEAATLIRSMDWVMGDPWSRILDIIKRVVPAPVPTAAPPQPAPAPRTRGQRIAGRYFSADDPQWKHLIADVNAACREAVVETLPPWETIKGEWQQWPSRYGGAADMLDFLRRRAGLENSK